MKMTKRIQEIISFSSSAKKVCDIGCDHGLVGINLILEHNIDRVIFSDIISSPLQNAINNVSAFEIDKDKVDFRVGDGLTTIKEYEVDTVIITGMGGKTIVDILDANLTKTRSFQMFVLQPTNGEKTLRKWLSENDFIINNETLIEDNKVFYETLLVSNGKAVLNEEEITFGKHIDYSDATFVAKYNKVLENLTKIRNDIPDEYSEQKEKFDYEINMIQDVLSKGGRDKL